MCTVVQSQRNEGENMKVNLANKNIVIIDKQNEGVWKGRFDGIAIAKGEYIGFTDSDDYIC